MSFSYIDLPAYYKRDLRRTIGKWEEVFPFQESLDLLRLRVGAIVATGQSAMIEGWGLRRVAKDSSVRRAAEAVCHGKPWTFHYSRRGDLCFFMESPS